MLKVTPYELDDIKNEIKRIAVDDYGLIDAEFEGSNVSQLINLLAYTTVINNTNSTFGLNEMFISQAQDRRNVIKHARQMGYIHRRKSSFQYKIKLRSKVNGLVNLDKYSKFTSNGNNYVYMGDSITESFGSYIYLDLLTNEFENSLDNTPKTITDPADFKKWYELSEKIEEGSYIITEQGLVCKVIKKDVGTINRILVEQINDEDIPKLSNIGQEIMITDDTGPNGEGPYDASGYRNLLTVGNIDTFLYEKTIKTDDYEEGYLRVQVSPKKGVEFPFYTKIENPISKLVELADGSYAIRQFDSLSGSILPDAQQFKREVVEGEGEVVVGTQYPIKHVNSAYMISPDGSRVELDTCGLTNDDGTLFFDNQKIKTNEVHPASTVKNYGLQSALIRANNDILEDEELEVIIYYTDKTTVRLGDGNVVFVDGRWMYLDGQYAAPATGDYVPSDLVDDGLSVVQDGSYIMVDGDYIFIDGNKNWLKDAYHNTNGNYVYVDGNYKLVDGNDFFSPTEDIVTINGVEYTLDGDINYKLNVVEVTNGRYTVINQNGDTLYLSLDELYDGSINNNLIDGNYIYIDGEFTLVDAIPVDYTLADGNNFFVDGGILSVDGDSTLFYGVDSQYVIINGQYLHVNASDISSEGYSITDGNVVFIDGNYSFIDGNIPIAMPQITMTQEEIDAHNASGNIIYLDGNIVFNDGDEIFFLEQNGETSNYEGDSINSSVRKIQRIKRKDLVINGNNIIIPPQTTLVSCWKSEICGARIQTPFDNLKSVQEINIVTPDGQEFCHEEFLIEDGVIVLTVNGEPVPCYPDGSELCIDLEYYEKTARSNMILKYSYSGAPKDSIIELNYSYDKGADGYLDRKFYFSDLRGEDESMENDWDPSTNPNGFSGFTAVDYDDETNILSFKISTKKGLMTEISDPISTPIYDAYQIEIDALANNGTSLAVQTELIALKEIERDEAIRVALVNVDIPENYYENQHYANFYGNSSLVDDKIGKPLNIALSSPYRMTRLSECSYSIDELGVETYTPFDKTSAFAKISEIIEKKEIEVIVKEGTIKRWNEETELSVSNREIARANNLVEPAIEYKYPELVVYPNETMIKENKFTILNNDIEHDGIEMFVSRLNELNRIEETQWVNRNELLAENSDGNDETFVLASDLEYEEYTNVHTKYAGSGTPFSIDMTFRLNVLTSKGELGFSSDLIIPENENFEAIMYDDATQTPSILHIEGYGSESTDSIRENAPLFTNTANRAVTVKDYKTITEAQDFVAQAQIWGGETEQPNPRAGWINISIVPYSRPITFTADSNEIYTLDNSNNPSLSFPTYFQVTGKEKYNEVQSNNKAALFNILDKYKIITLQYDYIKPVYLDYSVVVDVVKYKIGQNTIETNKNIFNNIQDYFRNNIEKFDSSFFNSSLIRYMDEKLGDNYGVVSSLETSVSLYDNLGDPDAGSFYNKSLLDLVPESGTGYVGINDDWEAIIPLSFPLDNIFEETLLKKLVVIKRGGLIYDNLSSIDTKDFIEEGDYLFMEKYQKNYYSEDLSGIPENSYLDETLTREYFYPSEISSMIEIPIFYRKKDFAITNITYKVGTYTIYRDTEEIEVRLESNAKKNIDYNSDVIAHNLDGVVYYLDNSDNKVGNYIIQNRLNVNVIEFFYIDESANEFILNIIPEIEYINYDAIGKYFEQNDLGDITRYYLKAPLDRNDFIAERLLKIKSKDNNITGSKNLFQRLKKVTFK